MTNRMWRTARSALVLRVVGLTGLAGLAGLACLLVGPGCVPQRQVKSFSIPVPLGLQNAVAVDKDGNRILVGSFAGRLRITGGELASAGGTDIFIAKTNRDGAPAFPPQRFGGTGDDAATGVAIDQDGSIVVSGTFQGEVAFGAQSLKANVRHPGQRAVFVAKLDAGGKLLWVKQIAVVNSPTQVSVAVGPDHNISVGASMAGTVSQGGATAELAGQSLTLELLGPGGEPIIQPPGAQFQVLSIPVGCAHSPCQQGGVLVPNCGPDACVGWICNVDPYCCNIAWDSICVAEVGSVCQKRCDCGTICTQGNPFYAGACGCTGLVCNQDPYCCQTYWDSICIGEANTLCHSGCP